MKTLWTEKEAEFHGNYYDFPPLYSYPKPVQRPHPPVMLGGTSSNVFKRIARWGDGWIPTNVGPEDIRHGRQQLDDLSSFVGRDPASLNVTVFEPPADRDLIAHYAAAGADRVVLCPTGASAKVVLSEMEQIAFWACE
jgi:alkanesulfonate monooxygenase SsuD/methylene tetrahydromethanopterin reductase-like flavin-dependent oxidoreductase (luciferase family)